MWGGWGWRQIMAPLAAHCGAPSVAAADIWFLSRPVSLYKWSPLLVKPRNPISRRVGSFTYFRCCAGNAVAPEPRSDNPTSQAKSEKKKCKNTPFFASNIILIICLLKPEHLAVGGRGGWCFRWNFGLLGAWRPWLRYFATAINQVWPRKWCHLGRAICGYIVCNAKLWLKYICVNYLRSKFCTL